MTNESTGHEREKQTTAVMVDLLYKFPTTEEAIKHIGNLPEEHGHNINMAIEIPHLSAVVNGSFGTEQTVTLEAFGKSVTLPRKTYNNPEGIGVSASPDAPYGVSPARSINIEIGNVDDPDLDRGLAWIVTMNPDKPYMQFNLNRQMYTEEKVREIFKRVNANVRDYLMEALSGNIPHQPMAPYDTNKSPKA